MGAGAHSCTGCCWRSADAAHGFIRPPRTESAVEFAVRIASDLDNTVLAIQGPPGTGKTFTGAQMICALVEQGKRVGVTATSHKVIRNLLNAVAKVAPTQGIAPRLAHKVGDTDDEGGAGACGG